MNQNSRLTEDMINKYTGQGYWGSMTLADHLDHHAAYTPDKTALIDASTRLSYEEWRQMSNRVALWMVENDIRPGDRIGLLTPNWIEYFVVRIACAKIGAVVVPFIFNNREHEIVAGLKRSGAVGLFFCAGFNGVDYVKMVENLRPELHEVKQLVTIRGRAPNGMHSFSDIIDENTEQRYADGYLNQYRPDANDIDILMSTSGSTGLPKLVLRTPNIFLSLGHHIVNRAQMGPGEVLLSVAPVNQGTGYSVAVVASLIVGCTNILLEKFDAGEALRLMADEKVTMAVGVPTHMMKIMGHPTFNRFDLSALRLFYHAGAPIPRSSAEEFAHKCGCQLMEAYGALDGGTPVHTFLNDADDKTYGTAGKPCPGMELYIVDDSGKRLDPGQTGEIVYRGPTCAVGLLGDSDHAFDADGWFQSGDLGFLDDEGYLHVVGRKKNIIIRGGQNISPTEIEEGLINHPLITNIAVVKMLDAVMGEKVCAFVVGPKPLGVADLATYMTENGYAKYKIPERVENISDLPLLPNGKIDRVNLEKRLSKCLEAEQSNGVP